MKNFVLIGLLSLMTSALVAKKDPEAWKAEKTLENQYKTMKLNVSKWDGFLMIKEAPLNTFHKSMLDSVAGLEKTIASANSQVITAKSEIESLKKKLATTQEELEISLKKENELTTLGMPVNKNTFPGLLYTIILVVLLIGAIAFFLYFRSNVITKKTQKRNSELEEKLKTQKTIGLERETKLARELQNERNKNHSKKG